MLQLDNKDFPAEGGWDESWIRKAYNGIVRVRVRRVGEPHRQNMLVQMRVL